jgi:hypothetical protein
MVADFFSDPKGTRGRLDFALLRVLDDHPSVRFEPPRLELSSSLRDRSVRFFGTREDDEIRGTLTIEALQLIETPFTLHRLGEITAPPYAENPVRVQIGGVTLGGALLVPPGEGPHPAVVLIPAFDGGKGEMSRENLRYYADLFARGGIAALLYDQRSVGPTRRSQTSPGTPFTPVNLDVRAADALAAVGFLKGRPEIESRKIGLLGFELGGIVAPMAAAESADVAFVISVSGPGVPHSERMVHSLGERLRRLGFPYGDINAAMATFRRVLEYDRDGGDPAAMQAVLDRAAKARWAPYAELPSRPWRSRISPEERRDRYLDPAQYWQRVGVPVLLVFGMECEPFSSRESAERIEAALAHGGNHDLTVKLYPGDHRLLQARWFPHAMVDWLAKKM